MFDVSLFYIYVINNLNIQEHFQNINKDFVLNQSNCKLTNNGLN